METKMVFKVILMCLMCFALCNILLLCLGAADSQTILEARVTKLEQRIDSLEKLVEMRQKRQEKVRQEVAKTRVVRRTNVEYGNSIEKAMRLSDTHYKGPVEPYDLEYQDAVRGTRYIKYPERE